MKNKKYIIIPFIIILISVTIVTFMSWLYSYFGNLTFNEIVFHINVPLKGTNNQTVFDFFKSSTLTIIVMTLIIFGINYGFFERTKKAIVCSLIVLMISIVYVVNSTDMGAYIKSQLTTSEFIENEYIDPNSVEIKFPDKKRNLIYIYLESMETSHFSKDKGGRMHYNMIPELLELSEENISFSINDKYSGGFALSGATWTTGAMVAHSGGIPLITGLSDYNNYTNVDFLPGATLLGDILEKNGYNQELLIGSDAEFGGRKNLFEDHGNFKIFDVNTAIEKGYMKEEDKVWWGFSDEDLFKYAKEELLNISKEDKPFNFTMLTADTHFPGGYVCELCDPVVPTRYHYENVISCSSRQVGEFVKWIQEQDFYENTTIILCGDHLTMDQDLEIVHNLDFDPSYKRGIVNIFINSLVQIESDKTKNRKFSTMDIFPTTLAALGVQIEGNKLGLGVNLFSDELTLLQKYDESYVNSELDKKSIFYLEKILYNK